MTNLQNFILQNFTIEPHIVHATLTYVARKRNPRKINLEKFGQGSLQSTRLVPITYLTRDITTPRMTCGRVQYAQNFPNVLVF